MHSLPTSTISAPSLSLLPRLRLLALGALLGVALLAGGQGPGARAEVLELTVDNFMDVIDGPHHKIVKFYGTC